MFTYCIQWKHEGELGLVKNHDNYILLSLSALFHFMNQETILENWLHALRRFLPKQFLQQIPPLFSQ